MSIAAEKPAEVLALPGEDRALLARRLLASLDTPTDPDADKEWSEVIDRRSGDIEEGNLDCPPVEQAVQGIRNKVHARPQSS